MKIKFVEAEKGVPLERIYILGAVLKTFKGHPNVEIQIIRKGFSSTEAAEISEKNIIGKELFPFSGDILPPDARQNALRCVLEAFTRKEAEALASYLEKRYSRQIEELIICPMDLPVPLGAGPLGEMPESVTSGFIRFEDAPGYPLPFSVWGYFELGSQEERAG